MARRKRIVIDRAKWRRGGSDLDNKYGITTLLHAKTGMMCCLGQIALQCGLKPCDIEGYMSPENIPGAEDLDLDKKKAKYAVFIADGDGYAVPSGLADDAMEINDDKSLTDKQREEKLTELMKAHFILTFTGKGGL